MSELLQRSELTPIDDTMAVSDMRGLSPDPNVVAARERLLYTLGFDEGFVEAVRKEHPTLLGSDTETVVDRFNTLISAGIEDPILIIKKQHNILSMSVEDLQIRLDLLKTLGLTDLSRSLEMQPRLLMQKPETTQAKFDGLVALGLPATEMANKYS